MSAENSASAKNYSSLTKDAGTQQERRRKEIHFVPPLYYRLFLAIRGKFVRDVQASFQMTCSFVFAAIIAFHSDYEKKSATPYLLPIMAALLSFDTVGASLMSCRLAAVNLVPTAILIYILMQLGMGYHNYTSSSILFFFITFFIGYSNPIVGARKIALMFPVAIFPLLIQTPRKYIPEDLVWKLMGEMVIAIAITLAVTLFILPRYACVELQERVAYNLKKTAYVFELAILAILSNHKAKAEAYLTEASDILKNLQENQENMGVRMFLAQYEPVTLARMIFCRHQAAFNKLPIYELTGTSSSLLMHVSSMVHAVRDIHFHQFHAEAARESKDAFLKVTHHVRKVTKILGNRWQVHDLEQINEEIRAMQDACNEAYHTLGLSLKTADMKIKAQSRNETSEDAAAENLLKKNATFGFTVATDSNKDTYSVQSYMAPVATEATVVGKPAVVEGKASGESKGDGISDNQHLTEQIEYYDIDASKKGNRLPFSFMLFHFSEYLQTIENKFSTDLSKPAPSLSIVQRLQLWLNVCLIMPLQGFIGMQMAYYSVDHYNKILTGLRTALLMGVALIFVQVPALAEKFEQGQWIMYAMLFSQGDNFGGTLAQMRLRLLGTMMGAIYSYFVYVAVQFKEYDTIAMFVPFILICGYIKQSKTWSYFGTIAIATALIVTYGRNPYFYPVIGNYALLRIQQNALGIMLALTVSLISVPVYAIDILKYNIADVLVKFSSATSRINAEFEKSIKAESEEIREPSESQQRYFYNLLGEEGGDGSAGNNVVVEELEVVSVNEKVQRISYVMQESLFVRIKTAQQAALIEQASFELILSSKAFPEALYMSLRDIEGRVLQNIVSLDRALHRVSAFTSLKSAEPIVLFARQVSWQVQELLNKIARVLKVVARSLMNTLLVPGEYPMLPALKDIVLYRNNKAGEEAEDDEDIERRLTYETRRETFSEHMAILHQLAVKLHGLSDEFGLFKFDEWLDGVLRLSGVSLAQHLTPSKSAGANHTSSNYNIMINNVIGESSSPLPVDKEVSAVSGKTVAVDGGDGWQTEIEMAAIYTENQDQIAALETSGQSAANNSNLRESAMVIRRMFSISTAFNALFYASSDLSKATIELCNILFTVIELENRPQHRPY